MNDISFPVYRSDQGLIFLSPKAAEQFQTMAYSKGIKAAHVAQEALHEGVANLVGLQFDKQHYAYYDPEDYLNIASACEVFHELSQEHSVSDEPAIAENIVEYEAEATLEAIPAELPQVSVDIPVELLTVDKATEVSTSLATSMGGETVTNVEDLVKYISTLGCQLFQMNDIGNQLSNCYQIELYALLLMDILKSSDLSPSDILTTELIKALKEARRFLHKRRSNNKHLQDRINTADATIRAIEEWPGLK